MQLHDIVSELLSVPLFIATITRKTLLADRVCRHCQTMIRPYTLDVGLIELEMHDFDVILGMN